MKKGDKVYEIRDIQTLEVLETGHAEIDGIMARVSHLPVMKPEVVAAYIIPAEELKREL